MPAPDEVDLVGVLLPPPEAATVVVACWEAGEAVLPLNPAAPAAEVRRTVDALRPTVIVDRDGRGARRADGRGVAAGVAAVVTTSGTTGEPKGVELTTAGLQASAAAVSAAVGAGDGASWLCCLPLHNVAGLAVVGRAWASDRPAAVHAGFSEAAVADAARAADAPFVSLVPTMLLRLLDAGAGPALRGYRRILLGGGAIDGDLLRRARSERLAVSTTYGMTETWGGVVHDGHPLGGVELRLSEAGEIQVRGAMVMRGYRFAPAETAAVMGADGWYSTGDVGRFDDSAGGRLWVVDRLRDIVKTGGVAVSPTEVERVLATHPAVADVCVAGRPDTEWGERLVAYVVPHATGPVPTLAELRAFTLERLAPPKAPREVVVIDAVPRSPGGKILRRLLPPA